MAIDGRITKKEIFWFFSMIMIFTGLNIVFPKVFQLFLDIYPNEMFWGILIIIGGFFLFKVK